MKNNKDRQELIITSRGESSEVYEENGFFKLLVDNPPITPEEVREIIKTRRYNESVIRWLTLYCILFEKYVYFGFSKNEDNTYNLELSHNKF